MKPGAFGRRLVGGCVGGCLGVGCIGVCVVVQVGGAAGGAFGVLLLLVMCAGGGCSGFVCGGPCAGCRVGILFSGAFFSDHGTTTAYFGWLLLLFLLAMVSNTRMMMTCASQA